MKKTFLKLFVALMALVILCTQLPLGFLAGAVDMTPTEYPANTVVKMSADLEYTGMIPNAAQTETDFENPIDLSSDDIDYFEFDMQITPSAAFSGTVEIALYDDFGGYATYEIPAEINKWLHIKIAPEDFVLDGIDLQNVIGYRINNPESWVKYTFVNLCLTGIMRPTDIPEGDVDYLIERLDFVDDKPNSSSSDIFEFDETEQVDFLAKDWLEFDVFIVDGKNESVATNIGLTFTDINFDEATSKFGRNTLYLSNNTTSWFFNVGFIINLTPYFL